MISITLLAVCIIYGRGSPFPIDFSSQYNILDESFLLLTTITELHDYNLFHILSHPSSKLLSSNPRQDRRGLVILFVCVIHVHFLTARS